MHTYLKALYDQAVMMHTFSPSTWKAEMGRFLWQSPATEFQDIQGYYTEKPYIEKP